MNPPLSYHDLVANNLWMDEQPEHDKQPDTDRAMQQWTDLYQYVASNAVVYLLPTPQDTHLQDLTFVANLGIALTHDDYTNTVVLSNYTSTPRLGEATVGERFFQQFGYNVHQPASKFEGEADLKHVTGNTYIGGYGQRSTREAYEWMTEQFGMNIIPVNMADEHLYHLDCSIFPITNDCTLVCTDKFTTDELTAIEQHTEVIDVTTDSALAGICNSVRLHTTVLASSDLQDLTASSDDYAWERGKVRELEDICDSLGLELVLFNTSEFAKAGALLSCQVMHLNRHAYTIDLA